jgi:hypothetical protein
MYGSHDDDDECGMVGEKDWSTMGIQVAFLKRHVWPLILALEIEGSRITIKMA